MPRRILAIAAAGLAILAAPSYAASRIVPAEPLPFEPVNLRMTADSCAFSAATVRIAAIGSTLRITQQPNACLVAGTPQVVDVRLGSLAAGDYRVELYPGPSTDSAPAETLSFAVRPRLEVAVFPPPPHPLTDYTGLWWNASESGWGLSLHQSAADAVFGAWFVYGPTRQPEWFTLQGGHWTSATRWTGSLYRTTGPWFAAADYDPRLVTVQPVGPVTLDFSQIPGEEGRARFTYTVDGATTTKIVVRAPQ